MKSFQTLIKPTRDKKLYWLKCSLTTEPLWGEKSSRLEKMERLELLRRGRARLMEPVFIADMHKLGWEHDSRYDFRLSEPKPFIASVTLPKPRLLRARDMVEAVARGERFLDPGIEKVSLVPDLACCEWWEFQLKGAFTKTEIMVEIPDLHEEMN